MLGMAGEWPRAGPTRVRDRRGCGAALLARALVLDLAAARRPPPHRAPGARDGSARHSADRF
eukprot:3501082-Prymnesium_polylepis.1